MCVCAYPSHRIRADRVRTRRTKNDWARLLFLFRFQAFGVYKTVYENITTTFGNRPFLDDDRERTVFLACSTTTFTLKPRDLTQPNLEYSNDIDTIFETRTNRVRIRGHAWLHYKSLFYQSSCGRTITLYTRGADRGSNLFHRHYRAEHDNFAGTSRKNGKTLGRTHVCILGETRPTALWRVVA